MDSAIDDDVYPSPDLDLSIDLAAQGTSADDVDFQLDGHDTLTPENVAIEASVQEADLYNQGRVPTPISSPLSTSRIPGRNANRQAKLAGSKPKRVRTGCLTCRERHLKCDETSLRCQNCRKSGRVCRRGVRLNFIDTQTVAPPQYIARPPGTRVTFRDESRYIASEYVGGLERYPPPEMEPPLETGLQSGVTSLISSPMPPTSNFATMNDSFLPNSRATQPGSSNVKFDDRSRFMPHPCLHDQGASYAPFKATKQGKIDPNNRVYLNDPEDILLLQVFVEEVGLWMDSMDAGKHFTHILPFLALEQPMLLKALMACGARHLFLVNSSYGAEKASYLHDLASRDLLNSLHNPERDSALCATIAVVLNVYELMCLRSMHRMNHIAGARALIKECHWDARSVGLGGACFWLNVGMELLSCLHFNWTLAWDPDTWGIDMNMDEAEPSIAGNEEMWTHRMVYICAKVANLRSSISQSQVLNSPPSDMQINQRCQEWNTYSEWCDQWAKCVPRSMMPLGYLHPWQTNSTSRFPEIWLIKRSAIVARLFYHTTRLLLTKIHPLEPEFSPEMQNMQQIHAHDICGIVAHVKDRGIASLSIRFLAIAAECLVLREAQEEVIKIFDNIIKETGWRAECVKNELQEAWGWNFSHQQQIALPSADTAPLIDDPSSLNSTPPFTRVKVPPGVINPTMAFADFSMENHPYQEHYVAPHHTLNNYQYGNF